LDVMIRLLRASRLVCGVWKTNKSVVIEIDTLAITLSRHLPQPL